MRFEIDIDYPLEKMELSRKRLEARNNFQILDRVPVNYCVVARYFAPIFGLRYLDFFNDVETQYYWLLQFAKFHLENIPSDLCTEPVIYVHPFFDNAIPPSAHGAEIGMIEESPLRAIPTIHTLEAMDRYEAPPPDAGLRGISLEWWQQMRQFASQTRLSFQGREGRVDVAKLNLGGLSPHMLAVDLVGADFYWWMLEYPQNCHRFLEKITQGEIIAEEYVRKIDPRSRGDEFGLAEDSAQIMSPKLFKEFCVPYANMLFERFGPGGRHVHMCGSSSHLHSVLKKDMQMTSFDIFGYLVPPTVAAANLGGDTLMWGNVNPMLLKDGSPQEVKKAAKECLEALVPCGGFMLGDGANICPGTPVENFIAMMEAAEEYGLGEAG